jgi:hypothetical protein
MIIIWGTKVNQEPRGTVGDKCPACMDVQLFDVIDHYEVSHLYYISLGRGTLIATTRTCRHCGAQYHCDRAAYNEILPIEAANALPIEKVLIRTNSRLADLRTARADLQEMARTSSSAGAPSEVATGLMLPGTPLRDVAPTALDQELRELLASLEPYEDMEVAAQIMAKLRNWRHLDGTGREALLDAGNQFIQTQQKKGRAMAFISGIAPSYPRHAGLLPALGLFLALGFVFYLLLSFDVDPLVTFLYAVVGLLITFVVYYYCGQAAHRAWFRDVMIAQAHQEKVDVPTLAGLMSTLAQVNGLDEYTASMVSEARLFQEAVAELASLRRRLLGH